MIKALGLSGKLVERILDRHWKYMDGNDPIIRYLNSSKAFTFIQKIRECCLG